MKKIINGILIGIAAVVPGFSGGTIACVMGCYDELINAISNIKSDFKNSISTLLPYLLGILIGVCSLFPISWGINNYPLITVSLFAGLLVGSLPSFYKNIQGKSSKFNILGFSLACVVFLSIIILNLSLGSSNYVNINVNAWWSYILMVIIGVIGSAALVVPGISGSMVLMILGFYSPLMDIIKGFISSSLSSLGINVSLDFSSYFNQTTLGSNYILPSLILIILFALGIVLGFYFISKLMKYLLTKHRDITFFVIFGFIITSLVGIFAVENYYHNLDIIKIALAIILFILGAIGSFYLSKLGDKRKSLSNKDVN